MANEFVPALDRVDEWTDEEIETYSIPPQNHPDSDDVHEITSVKPDREAIRIYEAAKAIKADRRRFGSTIGAN